jgi:predicted O-methyltransferase YrrM
MVTLLVYLLRIIYVINDFLKTHQDYMSLDVFLKNHGFYNFEGYSQEIDEQVTDLISLTSKPNIRMMEIGFNAGHSAEVFLKNNPTLDLTSFDLGVHDYLSTGKDYIDILYPNRHTLILGDSTITVPKFASENKGITFDVIFIDGGHSYNIATADILNCKNLAHKDTIVIMDDTSYRDDCRIDYLIDVTKAWKEQISKNLIYQIDTRHYNIARGMSWGKYITVSSSSHSSSN